MGIFDSVFKNFFNKQVFGFGVNIDQEQVRLPVFPSWFYSAPFGQPRNINVAEVRSFAKSPWTQMIQNTIKRQVSTIPGELVNADEDDEQDYEPQKQIIIDFFENCNTDQETLYDILSPTINDVCSIDAGVWIKVFSLDSYMKGEIPQYNGFGETIGTRPGLVLKPLGQRKLKELRFADGSTLLRQTDIYRRTLAWYQYTYKNPRQAPTMFYPDEVVYLMMNKNTESVYGFSPVQGIQQVLELLIQSTRWNKDFFKNNALPSGIIGLPNADATSLEKFKDMWQKEFKGKPHKILYHNTDAKFSSFSPTTRDMEWLAGQQWYFHLVFGSYGMSPVEAGFHENVNQGNQAGQERVTVRNAIKPYLKLYENAINKFIIPELLGTPKPPIKWEFKPKDHVIEQIEFDQAMQEIQAGVLTINEYRKMKGRKPVEGGDEISKPSMNSYDVGMQQELNSNKDAEEQEEKESKQKEFLIPYKPAFQSYMLRGE